MQPTEKYSANSFLYENNEELKCEVSAPATTIEGTNITANRLTDKHYEECVTKRGLNPEWIAVNCRSMEIKDASDRLGYTAKSAGIWLEGINGFGQFRPNKPWKGENDKKAPKYRTAAKEEYDAMIPRNPSDPQYGTDLEALKALCYSRNGHPCQILVEGLFKGISGCSNGFPTVALAGVEMGLTPGKDDPQGKRYLVPTLERLARAGFGFIICFDSDQKQETRENVALATRKLALQLAKFKVPVYIGTGLWTPEEGKGMDDFIQLNGIDAFRENVLNKAIDLATWEQQFTQDNDIREISEAKFSQMFKAKYQAKMAWNVAAKAWYLYESKNKTGVWGEIPNEEAISIVITELKLLNVCDYTYRFVNSVLCLLKAELRINEWEVIKKLVCLEDCVVNTETLEASEHQPGYRFLSKLPYKWSDRALGCDPIKQWLLSACGDRPEWVEVIRACINATITERGGELQRFIELVGAGSSGKGTLLRIVQQLLGKGNYEVTSLREMEQNRFESAKFYGKKAIFITDSDKYACGVSKLKALTGDDEIPIEKKNVQQTGSFRFPGVVWIATNEPIQSSDYTNGLARRRLSLSFNKAVPVEERRDLIKEFEPYFPGLLFWALSMDLAEVADLVSNTSKRVASIGHFIAEVLLETNPLANWADQNLYYDPATETKIGDATGDVNYCLYANYSQWASANGCGTMTTQRFSSNLLNLLKTQLGIDAVKRRTQRGRFITCIGIRQPGHNFPLLISDKSNDDPKTKNDDPNDD